MLSILSFGGSIVAPDAPDTQFIRNFAVELRAYLAEEAARRVIMIVGGGGPARRYQAAYRELVESGSSEEQDWIGIMATRLNAQLIRGVFADLCPDPVVTDPTVVDTMEGRVLVAAGWKPGFSTDTDAVYLAEQFGGRPNYQSFEYRQGLLRRSPDQPRSHAPGCDKLARVPEAGGG